MTAKATGIRKIVSEITDGYVEAVMDAILEDDVKGFPITKAVWHFMCELKKNNIVDKSISDYAYTELKNLKSKKIHVVIYSNIISLTKSMVDFGLKKDFITDWLELVVNNILYIEESEKGEIMNIINEEQH